MQHTLSAIALHKKYHGKPIVNDISLKLHSGEIVGLLGPNGAGKTTSFYMLVGLVSIDKGNITLDQKNITHLPIHERAKLGINYLPQESSIFRKMTVSQNILSILELRANLTRQQRLEELERLLDEFRLTAIRNNLGWQLSGGERRRAEIARALATQPLFILLDEPFAGIDPISILDIKRIITHLSQKNIGVLITDHNVRETLGLCQRAYIVNQGQMICEGSAQIILNNKEVREVYLGDDFNL